MPQDMKAYLHLGMDEFELGGHTTPVYRRTAGQQSNPQIALRLLPKRFQIQNKPISSCWQQCCQCYPELLSAIEIQLPDPGRQELSPISQTVQWSLRLCENCRLRVFKKVILIAS